MYPGCNLCYFTDYLLLLDEVNLLFQMWQDWEWRVEIHTGIAAYLSSKWHARHTVGQQIMSKILGNSAIRFLRSSFFLSSVGLPLTVAMRCWTTWRPHRSVAHSNRECGYFLGDNQLVAFPMLYESLLKELAAWDPIIRGNFVLLIDRLTLPFNQQIFASNVRRKMIGPPVAVIALLPRGEKCVSEKPQYRSVGIASIYTPVSGRRQTIVAFLLLLGWMPALMKSVSSLLATRARGLDSSMMRPRPVFGFLVLFFELQTTSFEKQNAHALSI